MFACTKPSKEKTFYQETNEMNEEWPTTYVAYLFYQQQIKIYSNIFKNHTSFHWQGCYTYPSFWFVCVHPAFYLKNRNQTNTAASLEGPFFLCDLELGIFRAPGGMRISAESTLS